MFKVGELVKWMEPLDHEYSYGNILEIKRSIATLIEVGSPYAGHKRYIHLRYIEHMERGLKCEHSKRYNK